MEKLLQQFYELTQIDIKEFFRDTEFFLLNSYPKIVEFYSFNSSSDNIKDLILVLDKLDYRSEQILSLLQINNHILLPGAWEVLELVDEIKLNLLSVRNTPKWLRSSIKKGLYSQSFESEQVLKTKTDN